MPLVVKDRVRETSTTAGTGTFTLAGAVLGYQSFSAIGNGNTTYYTIYLQGGNEWEVGIGTYTASGTTLSRDTILASSNGGSAVNFSAGVKDVFVTYPAGRSVYYDTATNVTLNALTVTGALAANGGTTIGDASGDAFTINSSAVSVPNGLNFDSNTLVVDAANDRVGIGTASPANKLHVNGAAENVHIILTNSTSGSTISDGFQLICETGTANAYILQRENSPILFYTNNTEKMRLLGGTGTNLNIGGNFTSTNNTLQVTGNAAIGYTAAAPTTGLIVAGNVGIGTDSPAYRLDVSGQARALEGGTGSGDGGLIGATAAQNGNAGVLFQTNSASRWNLTTQGTNGANLRFYNYALASTVATFDSSGNFGLGVQPSAWSGVKAFDIGATGSFYGTGADLGVVSNAYYNGANWIYKTGTAGTPLYASRYQALVGTGVQAWFTAPSGVAGNTVAFAQAMTLNASGNFGIGETNPAYKLHVSNSAADTNTFVGQSSTVGLFTQWRYNATAANAYGEISTYGGNNALYIQGQSGGANTIINAQSGNTLIGTTTNTNSSKLVVNGTISETVGGVQYLVASQADIGTAPNEIPLNQYLGNLAYQDAGSIAGQVGLSAGTAALPSLVSATDTDTGMWFPAANTLAWSTNGTRAMTVDSSQRVGIGTASPTTKLHVNDLTTDSFKAINVTAGGAGADAGIRLSGAGGNAFRIQQPSASAGLFFFDETNGTTRLTIDSSGSVGVGATLPSRRLTINDATTSYLGHQVAGSEKWVTGVDTSTRYIIFDTTAAANRLMIDTAGNIGMGVTPGVDWNSNFRVFTGGLSGASALIFGLGGAPRTELSYNYYRTNTPASLRVVAEGASTYLQSNGSHIWNVAGSGAAGSAITFTQAMTLNASGYLGLGGTTNPSYFLDITGNASTAANNSATGSDVRLRNIYTRSRANSAGISGGLYAGQLFHSSGGAQFEIYNADNDALVFGTNATERARITSGGDFGIGTTNPLTKLHVVKTGAGLQEVAYLSNEQTAAAGVGPRLTFLGGASIGMGTVEMAWDGAATTDAYLAFRTRGASNVTERARITSGGNLLVQTDNSSTTAGVGVKINASATAPVVSVVGSASTNADPTYLLYSTGAAAYRFYVDFAGNINATNTTIAGISDQRLKENIRDLDVGLDAILALKPRKFDWKAGKGKDKKDDRGFIAQEFEQVFPDLVDKWLDPAPEGEEPYKSVRPDLIPVLVKAIQEQQAMIKQLEAKVAALETK